jgi:exosortase O
VSALLLFSAWAFAWRSSIAYVASSLSIPVALIGVALLVLEARRLRSKGQLSFRSALRPWPLALAFAALIANVFFARVLDIRLLAGAAMILGTYGLCGLYLRPEVWRRGLAGALLLVLALPFGEQATTYAGFTARALTAGVVTKLLGALGIEAVSSSTVLSLESGVAYVDAPCSGLMSLWTGALFFAATSFVYRVKLDLRWVLRASLFFAAILAANTARVFAIVLLASVLELPRAAAVLHQPIGVIGFLFACAFGFVLLRRARVAEDTVAVEPETSARFNPALLALPILILALLGARPDAVEKPIDLAVSLPFETAPVALSKAEEGLISRVGESTLQKVRFDAGELSGTALFFATDRFRAHHPPELCLASSGAKIDDIQELELGPHRRARLLSIDGGTRTALYFYQSGEETTGDILGRIFSDVFSGSHRWVLVSILIDRPVAAGDPRLNDLFESFRRGVKS